MMLQLSEIQAMVQLLDDTDGEVVRLVEERILSLGTEIIPILEDQWLLDFNMTQQSRLEDLIRKIQFERLQNELRQWRDSDQQDLLEGIIILSKYQQPDLDSLEINRQLEKIRLDAWLEMHYDLTALEKVRILNHIFYEVNGFRGNNEDYHSPLNSFIHSVLDRRLGNPISLAIVYSIVANRLGVPVMGVNLPQHFILAYLSDPALENSTPQDRNRMIREGKLTKSMFYINPFNKGLVFTRQNIDEFTSQLGLEHSPTFYTPCNNQEILKRVLRNLAGSYSRLGRKDKIQELRILMEILGGSLEFSVPDTNQDPEA